MVAALVGLLLATVPAPRIAYHEHLLSPATAKLLNLPVYDGAALLRDLDALGARQGVVLSMAYTYGDARKHVPDADAKTRAENDWTAGQIAASRGRLIGFCGVNPLRPAAADEVRRCARLPGMIGLKLHFANSGVSLRDPEQAAKARAIFALADALRLPIVVHMRARSGSDYGAEDARLFLDELLAVTPHVTVQIAHLGGSGLFPPDAQAAMAVFVDAIAQGDPRMAHVLFDLTSAIMPESTAEDGARVASVIRAVGPGRILFGTDLPVGGNPAPKQAWELLCAKVPLTDIEWRTIAENRAAYLTR